ncbi:MAG: hypothetical protein VR70_04015 [Rhodospirillaceae bacterium BRH_c57]|nr:MAG: hypothetical protein VR70_04015 [Rhodospirillaceae bacterium BRH_c57]
MANNDGPQGLDALTDNDDEEFVPDIPALESDEPGDEDDIEDEEGGKGKIALFGIIAAAAAIGAGGWFVMSGGEPNLTPTQVVEGEPVAETAREGAPTRTTPDSPAVPPAATGGATNTNLMKAVAVAPAGHTQWQWQAQNIENGQATFAFDNAAFWARRGTVPLVVSNEFRIHPIELRSFFNFDRDLIGPRFNGDVLELTGLKYKGVGGILSSIFGSGPPLDPKTAYISLPTGSRPPVQGDAMYTEFDGISKRVLGERAVAVDMFPMNREHTAYAVAIHMNPEPVVQTTCLVLFCRQNIAIKDDDLYWVVAAWDGADWRAVASASAKVDMGPGPHWVDRKTGAQVFLGKPEDRQMLFTMVGSDALFREEFARRDGKAYLTGSVVTAPDRAPAGQNQRLSVFAKNQPVRKEMIDVIASSRQAGFVFGQDLAVNCGDGDVCRAKFTLLDVTYADAPQAAWSGEMFARKFKLGAFVHGYMPMGTCMRLDMTPTKYLTQELRDRGVPDFCRRR